MFSVISLQPSGPNDSKLSVLDVFQLPAPVPDQHIKVHQRKKELSSFVFTEVHHLPSGCAARAAADGQEMTHYEQQREKLHLQDLPRVRNITVSGTETF